MIFTTSESLAVSLERWEWAEYASCALVALGCTGEYIAEFTDCWTAGLKERKDRLAKRSTLLLISALALELMCLVKTNSISGMLIGSLSEKASTAETKAQSALDKAGLAENNASEAFAKSDVAKGASENAQGKADAVAKRAEDIDADLARTQYLLSARSVVDPDSLAEQLKQYKGQTVHFESYNSEPDESLLCGQLLSAARMAEMNVPQDACGRLVQVGYPSTGVVISGPDIPQTLALAQIILHSSNLGPGGVVSGIKAPELRILVGAKPPFMIEQGRRGVKTPKTQSVKP
jgi:hypothetical protein